MDIKNIITIFYTLEEMTATVCTYDQSLSMLPSRERFVEDLLSFRKQFNHNFAAMIYDYMVFAIYRELIDGVRHCDDCFSVILGSDPRYVSLTDLEREHSKINPNDLFENANELFYYSHWHGPFGGYAWGEAVDFASQYGKISDVLYIDSMVDLQHNTDSVLNKENPFWQVGQSQCHQLQILLNKKRKSQSWILQNFNIVNRFFPLVVKKLILRYVNLYIPNWELKDIFLDDFYVTHNNQTFDEFMNYKPVKYTREFVLGPIASADDVFSDEYYY